MWSTRTQQTLLGFAVVTSVAVFSGCAAKDGYQLLQGVGSSSQRCEERRTAAEQQRCEADYQRSFEEYDQARTEVVAADE